VVRNPCCLRKLILNCVGIGRGTCWLFRARRIPNPPRSRREHKESQKLLERSHLQVTTHQTQNVRSLLSRHLCSGVGRLCSQPGLLLARREAAITGSHWFGVVGSKHPSLCQPFPDACKVNADRRACREAVRSPTSIGAKVLSLGPLPPMYGFALIAHAIRPDLQGVI
jgi:hypothetical protein